MEKLVGQTLAQLEALVTDLGLAKFVGKQLADWLYVKRVSTYDEMHNISLKARHLLAQHYEIGRSAPIQEAVSVDGTRKYLFAVGEKQYVECVYIPEDDRATLCVSSQVGCKMGCRFCMTGSLGFHGQLTVHEILNQLLYFPREATEDMLPLTNIVFMGEGEPMDNLEAVLQVTEILQADYGWAWSPKRITVSSVGILPALKEYIERSACHLAISLHNPIATERAKLMPIERRYPIAEVVKLIKRYDFSHQRRVSFEYICWGGQNDSLAHAQALVELLKGLECRVNLIRFHEGVEPRDGVELQASDQAQMLVFRDYLTQHGVTSTIRRSRGEDILAACGMLIAKQEGNQERNWSEY